MISRALYARSVCLRCQKRLLERPRVHSSLRNHPFRIDLLRRLSSSDSAWDRLDAESRDKKDVLSSNKDFRNDVSVPKDGPPQAQPSHSSQYAASEQDGAPSRTKPEAIAAAGEPTKRDGPLITRHYTGVDPKDRRDRRRVGNRSVYLQSEQLDVNMLGEKARTIIMREMGGNRKSIRELPVEELLPQEFDIKSSLEAEGKDFTMEEALANVDDIRPTDRIVSQAEFDGLLEVLVNGFTVAQLRAYLARENAKARTAPLEKVSEYGWMQDVNAWTPFLKPEMIGSPKERLALTLMIEVWRLNIREMVDGTGFFSARIKERFLALLARDDARLDAVRKAYLDDGESIELSNVRVRITATKAKTETILKKLDEAAQDVVTEHVDAPWLSNCDARSTLLHHLGQLTNTFITYSTKTYTLRVSWFKNGIADEGAGERLEHVVQRLLYTAFHPRDASVTLKYSPEDNAGRLIPELRGQEKLPWKDRLTQWSRLVTPAGRVSPSQSAFAFEASDLLPHPLRRPVQDPDTPWSKEYTSTVASFGQILHRSQNQFSLAAAAKANNHVFSPSAPHPTGLAALSEALPTTPTQPVLTTLVFGFHPHPSSREIEDLPRHLELHLTVPEELPEGPLTWDACNRHLVAVLSQNFTDVAYPSEPVDMRLSQSVLSAMSASALDASPFREYIETAKLDLLRGQLRPPSEIELSELPSTTNGSIIGGRAKYVFSGLELRRTLDAKYEGHMLHYTSVEAGLHSGRRSELVLEARPNEIDLLGESEKAFAERYLAVAHDLLKGRVFKWLGDRDVARESDDVVASDFEADQVLQGGELDVAEKQTRPAEETSTIATTAEEGETETPKTDEQEADTVPVEESEADIQKKDGL